MDFPAAEPAPPPLPPPPPPLIAFDRPYLTIRLDAPQRLIQTEWRGYALSSELREGLNLALGLARVHGITRWIADYRERRIIAPEDQKWVSEVWLPQLMTLPLRRLAIIESANVFGRMSVQTIMTRASDHIHWDTHYFSDPNDAQVWVREND